MQYDVEQDPLFEHLNPIRSVGGLPVLRSDLSWSKDCPGLYVMGQYAALELGPGAGNLAGGRSGAYRIVPSLKQRLYSSYKTSLK